MRSPYLVRVDVVPRGIAASGSRGRRRQALTREGVPRLEEQVHPEFPPGTRVVSKSVQIADLTALPWLDMNVGGRDTGRAHVRCERQGVIMRAVVVVLGALRAFSMG